MKTLLFCTFHCVMAAFAGAAAVGLLLTITGQIENTHKVDWVGFAVLSIVPIAAFAASVIFLWIEYDRAIHARNKNIQNMQELL